MNQNTSAKQLSQDTIMGQSQGNHVHYLQDHPIFAPELSARYSKRGQGAQDITGYHTMASEDHHHQETTKKRMSARGAVCYEVPPAHHPYCTHFLPTTPYKPLSGRTLPQPLEDFLRIDNDRRTRTLQTTSRIYCKNMLQDTLLIQEYVAR